MKRRATYLLGNGPYVVRDAVSGSCELAAVVVFDIPKKGVGGWAITESGERVRILVPRNGEAPMYPVWRL